MFIRLVISGLCLGGIYGLIALGYSLIYKASGLMNFAQGDLLTLGAFLGYTMCKVVGLPFFAAMILTMILMGVFGILLERGVIARITSNNSNAIYVVLATIAISYIIRNGAQFVWGTKMLSFPNILPGVKGIKIKSLNLMIQVEQIVCVLFSALFMVILHFFMTKTRFGTAMRAAALDPMAAKSCGINVTLTTAVTWGIAAGLASMGGILIGPLYGVYTTLGAGIGRKGFASAVSGGYGNMYGAMVGGLIIGLLETMIAGYLSSMYKDMCTYLLLLIFLFVKPTGLFNERTLQE